MEEYFFVVDESGAKGYSTNKEAFVGEVGVMAGILVPAEHLRLTRERLGKIAQGVTIDGKLHVADLLAEEQLRLRCAIFSFLKEVGARWMYEAIYVQGLHDSVELTNHISRKGREERRNSKIKVSEREAVELLHAHLFVGLFSKAMCFLLDRGIQGARITILTDQIDDSVVKHFRDEVDRFMRVGSPSTLLVTAWDSETHTKVYDTISFEPGQSGALLDLSGFEYEIRKEVTPLTLAADVLANSVYYEMKELQKRTPGAMPNLRSSIERHPLAHLVYGAVTKERAWFPDLMYAHPSSRLKNGEEDSD